jgi:hypothetical protein
VDVASDQTGVLAIISLKLRRLRERQAQQQKLDSGRLNETPKKVSAVEVRNKFQGLGEQKEMTIESFNQVLWEAGKKY